MADPFAKPLADAINARIRDVSIVPAGEGFPGSHIEVVPAPSANDCPECRQGKHTICVEWSLDDADNVVPCPCAERAHRMVSEVINLDEPLSERDAEVYGGAFVQPNTVRIYRVAYIGTEAEEAYWCPICGRISGAVYRGHGAEHIVPDASR